MVTCYDVKTSKLQWVWSHPARYEFFIAGIGPRSRDTRERTTFGPMGANRN